MLLPLAPSAAARRGRAGGRPRCRSASRWSTTGSSWRPRTASGSTARPAPRPTTRSTPPTSGCWPATRRPPGWRGRSSTRSSPTASPTATLARPGGAPAEYEDRGGARAPSPGASPPPAEQPFPLVFYGGDLAGHRPAARARRPAGRRTRSTSTRSSPRPPTTGTTWPTTTTSIRTWAATRRWPACARRSPPAGCATCSTWSRTTWAPPTPGSGRRRPIRMRPRRSSSPSRSTRTATSPGSACAEPAQARLPERRSSCAGWSPGRTRCCGAGSGRRTRSTAGGSTWPTCWGGPGRCSWPSEVARAIRRAVKETRPDAYLVGEHFFDASARLQGDQWDASMNYAGFTLPMWHWLRGFRQRAHRVDPDRPASPAPAAPRRWRRPGASGGRPSPGRWRCASTTCSAATTCRASAPWSRATTRCTGWRRRSSSPTRACRPSTTATRSAWPTSRGWGSGAAWSGTRRAGIAPLFAYYRQLIALRRRRRRRCRRRLPGAGGRARTPSPTSARARRGGCWWWRTAGSEPRPAGPLPVADGGVPEGLSWSSVFTGRTAVVRDGALQLPEQPQGATIWVAERDGGGPGV